MRTTIARTAMIHVMVLCSLFQTANSASATAEALFISQVRAAFDAKDSTKLLALVFWDRVEPSMRRGMEQQFENLMTLVPTKIELVPPEPSEQYEYSRGGTTYRTNLAVTKKLKIEFRSGNQFNTTGAVIPLGERDGRLFITTAVPVH